MKINNYNTPQFIKKFLTAKEEPITARKTAFLGKILNDINDLVLDEILLNNYNLRLGNSVYIKLVRKERNFDKLAVDWGKSNKLKKEILSRGGKPASKIGTNEKGNPIFDDGEKWMVFFTDDFYLTVKKTYTHKKVSETKFEKFAPNAIFWRFVLSSQAELRLSNYLNTKKLNKLDIPIYERDKNYIL